SGYREPGCRWTGGCNVGPRCGLPSRSPGPGPPAPVAGHPPGHWTDLNEDRSTDFAGPHPWSVAIARRALRAPFDALLRYFELRFRRGSDTNPELVSGAFLGQALFPPLLDNHHARLPRPTGRRRSPEAGVGVPAGSGWRHRGGGGIHRV